MPGAGLVALTAALWASPSLISDPPEIACARAAERAARVTSVNEELLISIGLTEAGRSVNGARAVIWPWTVTTIEGGAYFSSRRAALNEAIRLRDAGVRSFDLGCMQINYRWHGDAFDGRLERMLDPDANVRYAARHLHSLKGEQATWESAVALYHTRDADRGAAYAARVAQNRAFVAGVMNPPLQPGGHNLFANISQAEPLLEPAGFLMTKELKPWLPELESRDL